MYHDSSFLDNSLSRRALATTGDGILPPPILLPEALTSRGRLGGADTFLMPLRSSVQKSTPEVRYKCPLCSFSCFIRALCDHHVSNAHGSDSYGPHEVLVLPQIELPLTPCPGFPVQNGLMLNSAQAFGVNECPKLVAMLPPYPNQFQVEPLSPPPVSSFPEPSNPASNDSNGGNFHVCHYDGCGYACNSRKYFQRHLEYAHHKKRVFRCARCRFTSQDSTVYKNHLLEHLGL